MKMYNFLFFLIFTSTILVGCKKSVVDNNAKILLYAQKIVDIKLNEPVSLTFGDDDVISKVIWTISPEINNSITTIANNATIEFTAAGTYIVTATTDNVYAQYTITVNNKFFQPNYGSGFSLIASKLVKININEPILFKVYNPSTNNNINWSTSASNGGYTIKRDNVNKTATLFFTKVGYATITASDGLNEQRRTIWIDDSLVLNKNEYKTNFMLGDKLQLTPSIELVNGIKKLVITAKTFRKYNCLSDAVLSYSNNLEYQIDYAGVYISPTTCIARGAAVCVNSFKNIAVGTHPFAVNFANKTYVGTITLDNFGKYTFGWNNANEVTINPLVL